APLRWLGLSWTGVDADAIDRLARLPALPKLQRLDLPGARGITAKPIVRLLEAHPDLVIALPNCSLDDAQVRAILRAAPQLRGLDVRQNPLTVAVLRGMVALPRLRYLGFDPDRDARRDSRARGRARDDRMVRARSEDRRGSDRRHAQEVPEQAALHHAL